MEEPVGLRFIGEQRHDRQAAIHGNSQDDYWAIMCRRRLQEYRYRLAEVRMSDHFTVTDTGVAFSISFRIAAGECVTVSFGDEYHG
ncbi:MAG: hypothetical protein ACLTSZ_14835 [Lachnospiraceae bacterium]